MRFADIKAQFPLLTSQPNLVYLDSAATSQKPQTVIDAIDNYYKQQNANIHRGIYDLAELSTAQYEESRQAVADFIHAKTADEIIFVRNATEAINLVAYSWARVNLQKGDVIVTTILEHHSNLVPWLVLKEELGVEVKLVGLNDQGEFDLVQYREYLKLAPKLVALTQMSNVLGTILSVKEMNKEAKEVGAITVIDACQSVGRMAINVQDLDCDFLAFSGHKMYGPMGIGVLYGKENLLRTMPPFLFGGGMISRVGVEEVTWAQIPAKFEAGTPNVAGAIGLMAAINFLNELGMDKVWEHDQTLVKYVVEKLKELDFVKVLGPDDVMKRGGAISFVVDGVHPHDVAQVANDEFKVCLRAGHHCCQVLMDELKVSATTRISFGVYTTEADIDKAVDALIKAKEFWGK